jgi:hypothetical protein
VVVDDIAPEQHRLITLAEEVAGVAGRVTAEVDGTHAGNRLGAILKGHGPAGIAVRVQDARCRLIYEHRCRPAAVAASTVKPVLGIGSCGVDRGARKDRLAVVISVRRHGRGADG